MTSEPTAIAAVCVEALQVAEIQDFGLGRVADDGDLAGAVRDRGTSSRNDNHRNVWMSKRSSGTSGL